MCDVDLPYGILMDVLAFPSPMHGARVPIDAGLMS